MQKKMLERHLLTKEKKFNNCWDFFNCSEETKSKCNVFFYDLSPECWLFKKPKKIKNIKIVKIASGLKKKTLN